ncbi:MAG: ROK family protein [Rhodobacteraceae bacterium]|nr:ROK family protein [Paracoccaceae bacterium]
MKRLAQYLTGHSHDAYFIASNRAEDNEAGRVWTVWCDLIAGLISTLTATLHPNPVILGGGMSTIKGLIPDFEAALAPYAWPGHHLPNLPLATKDDTVAAPGAAYSAWREQADV